MPVAFCVPQCTPSLPIETDYTVMYPGASAFLRIGHCHITTPIAVELRQKSVSAARRILSNNVIRIETARNHLRQTNVDVFKVHSVRDFVTIEYAPLVASSQWVLFCAPTSSSKWLQLHATVGSGCGVKLM